MVSYPVDYGYSWSTNHYISDDRPWVISFNHSKHDSNDEVIEFISGILYEAPQEFIE